jgi:hypothetical protein
VRNVYVREDVVLVWLVEHLASDPRRPGDEVEQSAVNQAALWLRVQSKVIVCGEADVNPAFRS